MQAQPKMFVMPCLASNQPATATTEYLVINCQLVEPAGTLTSQVYQRAVAADKLPKYCPEVANLVYW